MTAHSKIGASSMKRWAACPGSVVLSEGIAGRSSAAAEEGTLAHALAESLLRGEQYKAGDRFAYDDHGKVKHAEVTQEMLSHLDVYVDVVLERAKGVGDGHLLIEQKFALNQLHPDLFGTSDTVVWQEKKRRLTVADLKYGAGVAVEVKDNPQLRYYALGALYANPQWKPVEIEVVIVQPRCPHEDGPVRSEVIQVVDLIEFAGELVAAAERVDAARKWHPDGDPAWENDWLFEGDHCRWCPAAATCPKLAGRAQETAKVVFAPGLPYDADKLAETLEWLPVLEGWIKNVREFAYAEAEKGHGIPRHKLVEKRATRKWAHGLDTTVVCLGRAGLSRKDVFTEPELKSPAVIEKLLPKDQRSILDELCVKESSGHTLVHESDKRDAVKIDAKAAFQGQ